jgi:hypothetical protein
MACLTVARLVRNAGLPVRITWSQVAADGANQVNSHRVSSASNTALRAVAGTKAAAVGGHDHHQRFGSTNRVGHPAGRTGSPEMPMRLSIPIEPPSQ